MSLRMAFETVGKGPPVIILHGLFGSGRNWVQIAQALDHAYRFYLPDARNHGASPWAETMSYPEMARDVLAFIEREQLQRPILIGHSMGGKTAMTLALQHPRLIGGVAVIDIAPEDYADQLAPYVSAMRGLGAEAPLDFMPTDVPPTLRPNLRRYEDRFDWRLNLLAASLCMPDLCGFPAHLAHARFDGPTLFVSGADSNYLRPDSHAGIRQRFPRARLEAILDAGHWVHADQPEALLQVLHGWLRQTLAPGVAPLQPALATH
jgi:esterase